MKRYIKALLSISLISCTYSASPEDVAKTTLKNFIENNSLFRKSKSEDYFQLFAESQSPKATLVMCSDSRSQTDAFQPNAANEIFVIRNIGNQLGTAKGSIEYGILHLNTPLLIFVGHSDCGAIKAARSHYECETDGIKKELDGIDIQHIKDLKGAIIENVHHQADEAMTQFKTEVTDKKLTVVGALYDFKNDYNQGHGAFIIVNINGEKDPEKFKSLAILNGVEKVKVLTPTPPTR